MVHCLHSLVGKPSTITEVAELQLAGCALVAVLFNVELLENSEMQHLLPELIKVLKFPSTHSAFDQGWRATFHRCNATDRYAFSRHNLLIFAITVCIFLEFHSLLSSRSKLVLPALQKFWVYMTKIDRMHLDILPVLLEVSGNWSPGDVFQVIGCTQSTLSSYVTKTGLSW